MAKKNLTKKKENETTKNSIRFMKRNGETKSLFIQSKVVRSEKKVGKCRRVRARDECSDECK